MRTIRKLLLLATIALSIASLTSGCVYRINIQQGNHIDPNAVEG